jgi:hypothetical protein
MLKRVIILGLGLAFLGFTGCKDKEETTNTSTGKLSDADKKKLIDKIWYPTISSGGVNIEYKSGGIYRINKSLDGTWAWLNNGDTMTIVDYANGKYKNVFVTVGTNQITFRSSQGGDNFATLLTMKDTE